MPYIKQLMEYNKLAKTEIDSLLKDFFQSFNINFFIYRSFFENGDMIYLTNHHDWLLYRVENLPWVSPILEKEYAYFLKKDFSCFLWSGTPDKSDAIYKRLYDFDIWNGLSIYESQEDSFNVWGFASTLCNDTVLDLYINKASLFAQWIAAFKATRTYSERLKYKIPFGKKSIFVKKTEAKKTDFFEKNKKNTSYTIDLCYQQIKVTPRELDCLMLLSKGFSAKQISKKLNISPRTVEVYIANLREKTNCSSTSFLISEFIKNPINKILSQ